MKKIFAKNLKPGACIGIIALATGVADRDFSQALQYLQALGYTYKLSPTLEVNIGYFPGEDQWRCNELMKFFLDDEVDCILCYGGGYGSARILPYIDFSIIKKNPKLFIGYSDITALLNNIYQETGLVTIHGPMLKSFTRFCTKYTKDMFSRGLAERIKGAYPMPQNYSLEAVIEGRTQGTIVGGNLAILASLCGTPYEVKAQGKILFIEEVGEAAYAIDRMLNQLEQAGVTKGMLGLIWGKFAKCGPNRVEPYEYTVNEVLEAYSKLWNVPTIKNLPVGHLPHNGFLPIGAKAEIIAGAKSKLTILEE